MKMMPKWIAEYKGVPIQQEKTPKQIPTIRIKSVDQKTSPSDRYVILELSPEVSIFKLKILIKKFLVKNITFGKKKFLSKISLLVKKLLVKNITFGKKVWSKISLLVKNITFGQKYHFWSKISLLVKNQTFRQKYKFASKIKNFRTELSIWLEKRLIQEV